MILTCKQNHTGGLKMVQVKVDPGICGQKTCIKLAQLDSQKIKIDIQSDCPDINKLGEEIGEVDAYDEIFANIGSSPVYNKACKYCGHAACPVPMAILKGIEVASGLALAKDVNIEIEKIAE